MAQNSTESQARAVATQFKGFLAPVERASRSITIASPEDYISWSEMLKVVKGQIKDAKARYKEFKEPLNRLRKLLAEVFDPTIKRAEIVEESIKAALLEWHERDERRRQAEQAQIQATLDQEYAERQEKAERTALAFEASGEEEPAEVIREAAQAELPPARVYVPPAAPKIEGQTFPTVWKYEILNEAMLPRWALMPNHAKLREVAEARKGEAEVAGVRFYPERVMTSTSA